MSEPAVSISLVAPVAEVLRLFAAYPFHHLPVVDKAKVVGMLSSTDLLKLAGFLPKRGAISTDYLNQRLHIEQLMRRPPITVSGTQSVEQAAHLMTKHGIHALPVTDSNDNLLGILTSTDLINAALHAGRRGAAEGPRPAGADSGAGPADVSPAQMREAAELAAKAVDLGDDGGKIARALLYAQFRLKALENVLAFADRYVSAGQDESVHSLLVRAISRAKEGGGSMPFPGN